MTEYCNSIYRTKRLQTRPVFVGSVGVGGDHPIRIQSMTTSDTKDAIATADQIMKLSDWGCEIVRVTVQGMKEAQSCEEIKNRLLQRGYTIPIVADIHFYPPAAMSVVDFVDKVRINPGNFVDKRATFKVLEYNDASYKSELLRIEEKFTPLVEKCIRLKRAMRIGTNHGSLSDRIMNRYGDTPQGMVESALEFARICRKNNYHDLIFSMKASNPQVMIMAYRLLVAEMKKLGWDYPLHLGVTEAGEGEDGRIKSAMGIGSLLLDGLGDTIRVSLTEDAWYEIDPCQRLVKLAQGYEGKGVAPFQERHRSIDKNQRRSVTLPSNMSMHRDGTVISVVTSSDILQNNFYQSLGCKEQLGRPQLQKASSDLLVVKEASDDPEVGAKLKHLKEIGLYALKSGAKMDLIDAGEENSSFGIVIEDSTGPEQWDSIKALKPSLIFLKPKENRLHFCRYFFEWLSKEKLQIPVILNFSYDCMPQDLIIHAAAECGSLLCDGLGDGICLEGPYSLITLRQLSFNILQAARMRTFKTEFISCPSCGRTLFNLQEVTKRIHAKTSHLPGVKIAIMGCIVNGPGEMADADFGYVGSRPGKIDLYIGKKCVQKDIDAACADDELVKLIKQEGRWVEPEAILQLA